MKQSTLTINGSGWQSLNALAGATVGKKLTIQVITGTDVRFFTGDTPPAESNHGFSFNEEEWIIVESGSPETYVYASEGLHGALLEVMWL